MGSRKMSWLSATHPEAPRVSQIFSFGHETGDISEQLVKVPVLQDNFAETTVLHLFGNPNPNLSVSVSSPHDVATFRILVEGDDPCCPWSIFRSTSVTSAPSVNLLSGRLVAETQVQNRVSGHKTRIEKGRKGGSKGKWRIYQKGETRRRTCYQMWKRNLENLCCSCPQ